MKLLAEVKSWWGGHVALAYVTLVLLWAALAAATVA